MSDPAPILVIGYGNELRGDDAAGPHVAAAVADWGFEQVQAMAVHQLTPELSETIARAGAVIFVDALFPQGRAEVEILRLEPACQPEVWNHKSDPRSLLGLAQALFGHCPPGWLITIPAVSFNFGAPASAETEQGIRAAIERIRELLRQLVEGTRPSLAG